MQEQFTKRASITTGNQQQVGPDYLGLVVNRYVFTVQYNTIQKISGFAVPITILR